MDVLKSIHSMIDLERYVKMVAAEKKSGRDSGPTTDFVGSHEANELAANGVRTYGGPEPPNALGC